VSDLWCGLVWCGVVWHTGRRQGVHAPTGILWPVGVCIGYTMSQMQRTTHTYIHTYIIHLRYGLKWDLLDARGQNRVIVTIMTASPRAFQRCIGLGGVDKVLVRLEDYFSAETTVWQLVLPSRGLTLLCLRCQLSRTEFAFVLLGRAGRCRHVAGRNASIGLCAITMDGGIMARAR
jgi:hypothetical protein